MSLNRYAARRDQNERPIVKALRKAGALVMQLGKFDLLVYYRGTLFMVDPKMPKGKPTKAQQTLIDQGWPLRFVRDEIAALKAVGAIR